MIWIGESILFAYKALKENLLRTVLSLLGVTVGVFAIIAVLTIVEALDSSVRKSLTFLGSDVVYVDKFPWKFDRGLPWWKYMRRPNPTLAELQFLEDKLTAATAVSLYDFKGKQTIQKDNNSISNISVQGVTFKQNRVANLPIVQGRYFVETEVENGYPVTILGANAVEELFANQNPIGEFVKINENTFKVVGVLERQGENLLNFPSNDDLCLIPYSLFSKVFVSRQRTNAVIAAKGFSADTNLEELESQIRILLRAKRGIKPLEEDNFAINRPEMIADVVNSIIAVLTVASWFIGGFALLVGGFGIANIMFVTVKERTNIIGIQKALGAKNSFILSQFLFEAIFLSMIGGIVGLLPVSLLGLFSTEYFQISLSTTNILLGCAISAGIGTLAGIVPAYQASRLNPVEAIRAGI